MPRVPLNDIRAACAAFANRWREATREHADAHTFWDELFACYGSVRAQVARYEAPVRMLNDQIGFIDLLWKGALVVEHKSRGGDLDAAREQARDYIERLRPHERPRYLITCDFARFNVIDLHHGDEARSFTLEELSENAEAMAFIAGYEPKRPRSEAPVNLAAVELLGELYDELKIGGYPDHDLQEFLVRILFCLFAEDTGVFEPDAFSDFIRDRTSEDGGDLGVQLAMLFDVLNSPESGRQHGLDEALVGLPYVNGLLFERHLWLAAMTRGMRDALIACAEFDWSKISPAIFGSLFQSVMEPRERRAMGAHYTTEENILRVIRPLFLDDLRSRLAAIRNSPARGRVGRFEAYRQELATLSFLDPACGCGNFLIIAYRELRVLEREVLSDLYPPARRGFLDIEGLASVNVDQFYGIEVLEFPAQIARVAMWLMDHIENVELGFAFGQAFSRLPLTRAATIVHGDALKMPWDEVLPRGECSFVFGNPPFIGHHLQS